MPEQLEQIQARVDKYAAPCSITEATAVQNEFLRHAPADLLLLLGEVRRLYAVIDQSISDVQGISNLAGDDVPGLREMIHHLADQLGAALEGK